MNITFGLTLSIADKNLSSGISQFSSKGTPSGTRDKDLAIIPYMENVGTGKRTLSPHSPNAVRINCISSSEPLPIIILSDEIPTCEEIIFLSLDAEESG